VPDDRKSAFKEFVVRKRFQCSAAKVLERQLRIAVLDQGIGSSPVFDLVGFDKGFQCRNGILLGPFQPDLLRRALGLGAQALRILLRMFAVLCTQQRCSRVDDPTSPSDFKGSTAFPLR